MLGLSRSLLSVTPLLLNSLGLLLGDPLLSESLSFIERFAKLNLLLSLHSGDFSKASLFCRLGSFLLRSKSC